MMNNEFIKLFYSKLNLSNCPQEIQTTFLAKMSHYLKHGRKDLINGRTLSYIEKQLDKLIHFLKSIECTNTEIIEILSNLPTLLNTVNELYLKYLFLGIIENEENNFRKNKLITKTKDYMVGLSKIYARYKLICETGYNHFNWNNLVHSSDRDFSKIFVKGKYIKSYQLFDDSEQVTEWLAQVDTKEIDIEELKKWPVNKELVVKYEGNQEKNKRF